MVTASQGPLEQPSYEGVSSQWSYLGSSEGRPSMISVYIYKGIRV